MTELPAARDRSNQRFDATARRIGEIARHDVRLLLGEPFVLTMLFVLPVFLMAFFKPIAQLALRSSGIPGASGWEQSVPGMIITFGFFGAANFAFLTINERDWGTWNQLRMFTSRSYEILLGKIVAPLLVTFAQCATLFILAHFAFNLAIDSYLIVVTVTICLCACIVALGLAIAGMCRTLTQVNIVSNLIVVGFGTLGGAFLPLRVLPGWVQAVAPAIPAYWAMKGYGVALLPASSHGDWGVSCGVLMGFCAGFIVIAAWRFRIGETGPT